MEDIVWVVVSNGSAYRLRNKETGAFMTEDKRAPSLWGQISYKSPLEFKTMAEALEVARVNTWTAIKSS